MTRQILRKKFTVEQYHQMSELGILSDRDRVELIQGEILQISPIGRRHAACVDRLTERLILLLSTKAIIRSQNPIRLSNNSEPQPDIALLRRREDFYAENHPQPDDIFLVIEVSDTTVDFDREIKIPIYAEARIVEVWLIDLNAQQIEVYREPTSQGYQSVQILSREQTITLLAFPEIELSVQQILG
ncbi:MAG: Uma2 family endonuclease [Desertifilum sp.]|nr:Uma2 family endonuclease [Desertifilum sp.]